MVALNTASNEESMRQLDELEENLHSEDEEGGLRVCDIYIPPPVKPYCSSESKGPRLMITDIYIENFKSYAGKVRLGPFHHCFTSIIGPNGNGKSNVIDAMLFVFGYRAQKIRAKKISALLHQSSRFPNVNSCSVYVHFVEIEDRPDNTYITIPGTEFTVSRTANRDNSSFYCLNEKRVHFKEVAKLLKQHNIDLEHNRFLILQGEVESISMMKPKAVTENECGLLEYLEDIVGTSRYKEPLQKISEKTEVFEKEHTEKLSRCRLVEKELQTLEGPMDEAVSFLKLKNDWTTNKNIQYQLIMEDVNMEKTALETTKLEHADELDSHAKKQEELQKEKAEKEKVMQEELAKKEKLTSQYNDLQSKLKEASTKHTTVECQLQSYNTNRKNKMKTLTDEKQKLVDLEKLPEKNEKEIAESNKKIGKLQTEKAEQERTLAENMSQLQDLTKDLIRDKEGLEKQLVGLKRRVDETKSELTLVEAEMKILTQNETSQAKRLEQAQKSYDDAKEKYEAQLEKLSEIDETLPGEEARMKECQEQAVERRDREVVARDELKKCQSFLNDVKNSQQASVSQNKVINALMGEKKKGNLPGILGRLGDLGGIDVKYDVAISTCCGRLDNVVVDSVDTAQACIEYLKQFNVGRASFIALDKIQHLQRYCDQRNQYPENVSRLFDLVNVEDERVRVAFYFALRETLVATDLNQGTRIAYGAQRFKVVTLRGDVIETSGTMSGGGKQVSRNRMGREVATRTSGVEHKSDAEVKSAEQRAAKLQKEVELLHREGRELANEAARLTSIVQQKAQERKRLEISVRGLKDQLPHLEEALQKEQEKMQHTKSDAAKVAEMQTRVDAKKTLFDEAKEEAKELQVQVEAINSQINQIQNSKVIQVKKAIAALEKQIEKLTAHVSKMSAEVNAAERNKRKTEQKIVNLEEQIKELVTKIQEDCGVRDELDTTIEELTEEIAKIKEAVESGQNEELRKDIEKIKKELAAGKSIAMDLQEKINGISKKIAGLADQIPVVKRKINELKYMEIPNNAEPTPTLQVYTSEQLKEFQNGSITYKISVIEEEMRKLTPNLSVIAEYKEVKGKFDEQQSMLNEAAQKLEQMRSLYDTVYKKRHDEFMEAFRIISQKLKKMYQMITFRGDAELELADSMNPFSEGILFSVRPPKKSWKMISNLSGGEKTLASLALVFALHYYKPSPLYVMDEIDAALDFKNVSIVANYIKTRAKNSQFIIISLRPNMFELSDYLVGIYKVSDCTNALVVKNEPPPTPTTQDMQPPPMSQMIPDQ